jgi:hypothetical protein
VIRLAFLVAIGLSLSACDKVEHEPVKVIASPRTVPSSEAASVALTLVPPEPASASRANPAAAPPVSSSPAVTGRPGFIPADRLPPERGPQERGNNAFRQAVAERLCKSRPDLAQADGTIRR